MSESHRHARPPSWRSQSCRADAFDRHPYVELIILLYDDDDVVGQLVTAILNLAYSSLAIVCRMSLLDLSNWLGVQVCLDLLRPNVQVLFGTNIVIWF